MTGIVLVMNKLTVPWSQRRDLSVQAGCDQRTLEKVIRGEPVKSRAAAMRAVAALKKAGFEPPALVAWAPPERKAGAA